MSDKILEILTGNLGVDPQDVYRIDGPLGLGRLWNFMPSIGRI